MNTLTPRQAEIYEYMIRHVELHGRQPVAREIAKRFGINTPAGVFSHLKAIEKKGLIRLRKHTPGVEFVGVKFKREKVGVPHVN
jgi:SOS-response transcriptional repressor LexA